MNEKTFMDNFPTFLEEVIASASKISNKTNTEDFEPKTIWLVQHKNIDRLDWTCAFSSEELAIEFLEERLEMYLLQDVYVTQDECGAIYIAKDEDATVAVELYIEEIYLDCPDCGTVIL